MLSGGQNTSNTMRLHVQDLMQFEASAQENHSTNMSHLKGPGCTSEAVEVAQIYLDQAQSYCIQGNWEKAIEACHNALQIAPDKAEAYKILGNILQSMGQVAEAIGAYAKALYIRPTFVEVYVNLGSLYAKQQQWSQATKYYQKAIAFNPNFAGAYLNLAKVQAKLNQPEKQIYYLTKALTLNPKLGDAEEHYRIGTGLSDTGQVDEAIQFYKNAVELKPCFVEALGKLADLLEKKGDWKSAVLYYRQILDLSAPRAFKHQSQQSSIITVQAQPQKVLDRTLPPALSNDNTEAEAIIPKKKFVSSQDKIRRLLEDTHKQPKSATTQMHLGNLYAQKKCWKRAISAYKCALEINPKMVEGYCNLAKAFAKLDRRAEAAECWYQAFFLKPTLATGKQYFHLGYALLKQGKISKATDCYRRASELQPDFTEAYCQLGNIWANQGKYKDASSAYLKVLELEPSNLEVQRKLAKIQLYYTASEEAEESQVNNKKNEVNIEPEQRKISAISPHNSATKLAEQEPKCTLQQVNLAMKKHKNGETLQKKKLWEKAISAYTEAININPSFPWSHHNIGDCYKARKNWSAAASAYRRAIQMNPDFIWSYYSLGEVLENLEHWDEATAMFRRALVINPNVPNLYSKLADSVTRSTKLDISNAIRWYQEAIHTDPNNLDLYYKALSINPNNSKIYYQLGNALLRLQKKEQAIVFYKISSQLDPDFHAVKAQIKKLKKEKSKIEGFPKDLKIPPIMGENNDYEFIEEKAREFVNLGRPYTKAVSLVIPTYNRKELLSKTLAAITHQTYPKHLFEVIVADDGSSDRVEEVIRRYESILEIVHVRQQDKGYRLSHVRNLGVRTSKYNNIIILDCDVLPCPEFISAYMTYLHVAENVVLLGHRRFVCTDDITDSQILNNINSCISLPDICTNNDLWDKSRKIPTKDWRLKLYEETNYLKNEKYPFRAVVGATLAYSKKLANDIGGYDEDFLHWGEEDKEYGYRAYNAGYYFIPVLKATVLHQEPPEGENENDRRSGHSVTKKILEQKCPAGWYRKYKHENIFEVPKVSIYIPSFNNGSFIKECVDSVLNQSFTDLEVCIVDDGSTDNTLEVLSENYSDNPRVRWTKQSNCGIGKASNRAVRMCRGMYIGQLDSDDLLKPNAVETLVKYLDNNDIGCVYSSCERIDSKGNYIKDEYNWPYFTREKLLLTMIVHHFRMFRVKEWNRTIGFDENLVNAVDYDMFLKLSEVGTIHHINKSLYCRRIHGHNTSVKNVTTQDKNNNIVINAALKRMGLSKTWEVYSPDAKNPRVVAFRKLHR